MDALDAQTKQLSRPLEAQFAKLPPLPANIREFIVSVAPWVALILGGLSVLGFLLGVLGQGVTETLAPVGAMGKVSFTGLFIIPTLLSLIGGVLFLLSFQPLKKNQLRGWNLVFWVVILSLVSSLVVSSLIFYNITGIVLTLVVVVIELYILFQIKSHYK